MVFWAVLIGVVGLGLFLTWRYDRRRNAAPHAIESSIAQAQSKGALYNHPGGGSNTVTPGGF